ncbi:MAG: mechanosensitive ion channel domain-containing protein [Limnoraphis robusta]
MKHFKLLCRKFWFPLTLFIAVTAFLLITPITIAQTEDFVVPTPQQSPASPANQTQDGLYFADVLVRGRPIFQIGSLAEVSATNRAQIINRRITSLISQTDTVQPVTVNLNPNQNIATLQVRNRVLMTVTQQDAQDFGLELEALAQRWADQLNQAFDKRPLAIDVGQRLYETIRQFFRDTISNLPAIIGALIVILATWGVASGVRYAAFKWAQKTEGDSNTEILIGRLSYGAVWVLGTVVALGVLGLDFAALLGAFGLTSVAIGFSLKDVLSNYISGVILLAARPFRINDQVVIKEFEGTITQIQLRGTTLKTYDGRLVYIPNQEVFQASIINNTASPRRRSSVIVGIDYSEDLSTAQKIILNVLNNLSEVETNPAPDILVKELAPSTVNLEVRFWVDSRRAGYLATTSNVTQGIKEALEQANIDMPTDIYTLVFRNLPNQVNGNVTAQLNQE